MWFKPGWWEKTVFLQAELGQLADLFDSLMITDF
jgi:hypothetical protein